MYADYFLQKQHFRQNMIYYITWLIYLNFLKIEV